MAAASADAGAAGAAAGASDAGADAAGSRAGAAGDGGGAAARHRERYLRTCRAEAPNLAEQLRKPGHARAAGFENQVTQLHACLLGGAARGKPAHHDVSFHLGGIQAQPRARRTRRTSGGQHVALVAPPRKGPQPAPQGRIEPRPDVERGRGLKEGFQPGGDLAGRGDRQDVAGRNKAAIPVRAAVAELSALDDRHLPAVASQVISAGRPDHAAADDHDFAASH